MKTEFNKKPLFYEISIREVNGKYIWVRNDGEFVSRPHGSLEEALADTSAKITQKERDELCK